MGEVSLVQEWASLVIDFEAWQTSANPIEELVDFAWGEHIYGPIPRQKLKAKLYSIPNLNFSYGQVRPFQSNLPWIPIINHPYYQRRKLQVQKAEFNFSEFKEFWLLLNGVKTGPIPIEELRPKLGKNELLFIDQISFDNGKTWIRVFECEGLDRRKGQRPLPQTPIDEEEEYRSQEEAERSLKENEQRATKSTEAISILSKAKKENEDAQKSQALSQTAMYEEDLKKNKSGLKVRLYRKLRNGLISSTIIGLIFTLYFKATKTKNSTDEMAIIEEQQALETQGPMADKIEARQFPGPSDGLEPRPPQREGIREFSRSRYPADAGQSHSPGSSQSDGHVEENVNNDQAHFDDGDTPVEQDPHRSKLSKETIDPEETIEEERSPASQADPNQDEAPPELQQPEQGSFD